MGNTKRNKTTRPYDWERQPATGSGKSGERQCYPLIQTSCAEPAVSRASRFTSVQCFQAIGFLSSTVDPRLPSAICFALLGTSNGSTRPATCCAALLCSSDAVLVFLVVAVAVLYLPASGYTGWCCAPRCVLPVVLFGANSRAFIIIILPSRNPMLHDLENFSRTSAFAKRGQRASKAFRYTWCS